MREIKNCIALLILISLLIVSIGCNVTNDLNDTEDVILTEEKAFELLSGKLNISRTTFELSDIDEYGGYVFSTKKEYREEEQQYASFVVNPKTGIVYDNISHDYDAHLIEPNSGEVEALVLEEVEELMMTKKIVPIKGEEFFQHYSFEQGEIVLGLFKNKDYELINLYKVNPVTGDVIEYETKKYIGNLRE